MALDNTVFPYRAREAARRQQVNDDRFWKNYAFLFELRAPRSHLPASNMMLPLILNPTHIEMAEPYTLAITGTSEGGAYAEENGVIVRPIRIEGHTGVRPKWSRVELTVPDGGYTHARGRAHGREFSGQRYFQFLQDRIFRQYDELKRNPSTSKGVELVYHNLKDEEHWIVLPQVFKFVRDASRRFLYLFEIELLAVARDNEPKVQIEEQTSNYEGLFPLIPEKILAFPKSTTLAEPSSPLAGRILVEGANTRVRFRGPRLGALEKFRSVLDRFIGTVNDLRKIVNDARRWAVDVIQTVNKISAAIAAVTNFIEGVVDSVVSAIAAVADVIRTLDDAFTTLSLLPGRAWDRILSSLRSTEDACHDFITLTKAQEDAFDAFSKITGLARQSQIGTSVHAEALEDAENAPAESVRELGARGTGPMAGDRRRAKAERGASQTRLPTDTEPYEVQKTDTLESIARTRLGDARRWRELAALNGLRAPYISPSRKPGTVGTGDEILVPTRGGPKVRPLITVLGVPISRSFEERQFGRDWLLVRDDKGFFDMQADAAKGKTDFATVVGVENYSQALVIRGETERESDVLHPKLGHRRIMGTGTGAVDDEIVRLRMEEAVIADPRTMRIAATTVTRNSADAPEVDMDVVPLGYEEPVQISI